MVSRVSTGMPTIASSSSGTGNKNMASGLVRAKEVDGGEGTTAVRLKRSIQGCRGASVYEVLRRTHRGTIRT